MTTVYLGRGEERERAVRKLINLNFQTYQIFFYGTYQNYVLLVFKDVFL